MLRAVNQTLSRSIRQKPALSLRWPPTTTSAPLFQSRWLQHSARTNCSKRTSNLSLPVTFAAFLGLAFSTAFVYNQIGSNGTSGTRLYAHSESTTPHGEEEASEDLPAITLLSELDPSNLGPPEAVMEMDLVVNALSDGYLASGVETSLYQDAVMFCPPEGDASGIARVDSTGVSVKQNTGPSSIYMNMSFHPRPTHTWLVWGMFQGENGIDTAHWLAQIIPLAVAHDLGLLLQTYEREELRQAGGNVEDHEDGLSAFTGGSSYGREEETPHAFTPDIVRPFPPSHAIDQVFKDIFLKFDHYMVWTRLEMLLNRLAPGHFFPKITESSDDTTNYNGQQVSSAHPRQAAFHAVSDATHGASALVGLYESDTRIAKVVLCGEGRAVLARPVTNRAYRRSSSNLTARTPQSSSTSTPTPLESRKKREYANLYETIVVTSEHTPQNPAERERIVAQHPTTHEKLFSPAIGNDPAAPERETYMGISATRGFGNAFLKWPLHIQQWLRRNCMTDDPPTIFESGQVPSPTTPVNYSRPSKADDVAPYLTAEPDITTLTVAPGDFLVCGSKGLWECLSSEEVVGLVGAWLEERRLVNGGNQPARDSAPTPVGSSLTHAYGGSMRDPKAMAGGGLTESPTVPGLFSIPGFGSQTGSGEGEQAPARLIDPSQLPILSTPSHSKTESPPWRWKQWNPLSPASKPPPGSLKQRARSFILHPKDLQASVATHIVRNALGGADADLLTTLLHKSDKGGEKWRSDMSVQVIFFE